MQILEWINQVQTDLHCGLDAEAAEFRVIEHALETRPILLLNDVEMPGAALPIWNEVTEACFALLDQFQDSNLIKIVCLHPIRKLKKCFLLETYNLNDALFVLLNVSAEVNHSKLACVEQVAKTKTPLNQLGKVKSNLIEHNPKHAGVLVLQQLL